MSTYSISFIKLHFLFLSFISELTPFEAGYAAGGTYMDDKPPSYDSVVEDVQYYDQIVDGRLHHFVRIPYGQRLSPYQLQQIYDRAQKPL